MVAVAGRVLVVENDPDVREAVRFILENAGFIVLTARSEAEARACLRTEIVHAAVVDIRLEDDKRPGDDSGFDLARDIPSHIPIVVFTGYENLQTMRTAYEEVGAKRVISKKKRGAAAELKRCVEVMFEEDVKTNFALQIEGPLTPEAIAGRLKIPEDAPARPAADDVQEILQVLFREATAIVVAPLLATDPAPDMPQVRSVLARVRPRLDHGWGAGTVAKFGTRAEIEAEAQGYETLRKYAGGQRLPRKDGEAYSRAIGAVVYSPVGSRGGGSDFRGFAQFYAEEPAGRVARALGRFLRETFGELLGNSQEEWLDLGELYADSLRLKPDRLRRSLQDFHPEALTDSKLRFTGLPGSYNNPCLPIVRDERFPRVPALAPCCLCHGDLHARNLLLDDEGHTWLVDFARVGMSHAARDFAELESDIKFHLLGVSDLNLLLPFEQALLAPEQFGLNPSPATFGDPAIDKAYEVVVALRSLACELVRPPLERREYEAALLMHTLKILKLRHIRPEKKEHALLAASLLCERAIIP